MKRHPYILIGILFFIWSQILSCVPKIPKEALQLSKENLQNRQIQTRHFDIDEKTLLTASVTVLQDLGFAIDEIETDLGVIACSKTRDATSPGQVVGAIVLALFTGVVTPIDKDQLIRASLVTHPIIIDKNDKSKCRTAARITFQRIVKNTEGQVTRRECIIEPEIYREFFDKLSQSLFLEAHKI
ncbi:MAG: hypothetical protein JRH18_23790 [Deltaproteobacteria bacterium]|nr:hypothetical protein [Deltaproteobacteria bacterium]MBW2154670.1 hypothetical protein [Deltaproteobacteria bacterium]